LGGVPGASERKNVTLDEARSSNVTYVANALSSAGSSEASSSSRPFKTAAQAAATLHIASPMLGAWRRREDPSTCFHAHAQGDVSLSKGSSIARARP
jgi:hypothetical protein